MKKHKIGIKTTNLRLYGYIRKRAYERVDEFWNNFVNRLTNDYNKVFKPLPNIDSWKNQVSEIITKIVYSMAEYDKIYKVDKKKNEMITDSEKLDSLFWIVFYLPKITNAIIHKDKNSLQDLLNENESYAFNAWSDEHQKRITAETEMYKIKNDYEYKKLKQKNKKGRPPKFNSPEDFHKTVISIDNWSSLNKTQLGKRLGYKSCSGLNELLKSKGWSLPKT